MKKIFSLFTLAALLLSACEVITPPVTGGGDHSDEKNLLITESVVNVTAQSGDMWVQSQQHTRSLSSLSQVAA